MKRTCSFNFCGAEENRTPVQTKLLKAFYMFSLYSGISDRHQYKDHVGSSYFLNFRSVVGKVN